MKSFLRLPDLVHLVPGFVGRLPGLPPPLLVGPLEEKVVAGGLVGDPLRSPISLFLRLGSYPLGLRRTYARRGFVFYKCMRRRFSLLAKNCKTNETLYLFNPDPLKIESPFVFY